MVGETVVRIPNPCQEEILGVNLRQTIVFSVYCLRAHALGAISIPWDEWNL
jgi:hypothetical protein